MCTILKKKEKALLELKLSVIRASSEHKILGNSYKASLIAVSINIFYTTKNETKLHLFLFAVMQKHFKSNKKNIPFLQYILQAVEKNI